MLYPNEPNTTYDDPTNTTMQRAMFTTTAKHIVGRLDHTGSNYFMFRADTTGVLHLNYVHPAGATGQAQLRLFDASYNLVFSTMLDGPALLHQALPATGLYYLDLRAVTPLGPGEYALLPSISNGNGDDLMNGTAGNDIFTLDAGNDTVIGNGGFDVVRYPGSRFGSLLTFSDAGLGVHTTGQGKDTLVGISRIEFSDLTVDLGVGCEAAVLLRLYNAVFDRSPDAAGLGYWVHARDGGMSMLSVAAHFMQSGEFIARYGSNPSNDALVTGYYRNILDREPERAGIDFWLAVLDEGRASAAEVLCAISESAEHQAMLVGQVSHGVAYQPWQGP